MKFRHPFYLGYGTVLLALVSFWEYRGVSLTSIDEQRNVPKSIRDNPGAYRSIYRGYTRYMGGK
ncbi:MAG: hypothetical protein MUC42_04595 [Bryobacter sp.]|jgi:hypothetical protein|nr:hypothetical protein [Bryobacter sp.]